MDRVRGFGQPLILKIIGIPGPPVQELVQVLSVLRRVRASILLRVPVDGDQVLALRLEIDPVDTEAALRSCLFACLPAFHKKSSLQFPFVGSAWRHDRDFPEPQTEPTPSGYAWSGLDSIDPMITDFCMLSLCLPPQTVRCIGTGTQPISGNQDEIHAASCLMPSM